MPGIWEHVEAFDLGQFIVAAFKEDIHVAFEIGQRAAEVHYLIYLAINYGV